MDLRVLIFQNMGKFMLKNNVFFNFIEYQLGVLKTKGILFFIQKKTLPLVCRISELPLYILSIPLVIVTRLIAPLVLIRFGYIRNDVLGHFVFNPEYYLSEYDFNNLKSLDFFYFRFKVSPNLFWSDILRKYFKIHWFFRYLDHINKLIPGGGRHVVLQTSAAVAGSRDLSGYLANTKQHIKFTSSEDIKGSSYLKTLGMVESEKFICLVVRDSAYKSKLQTHIKSSWDYHNYRDCDIDTYNKVALELAQKGYWVFRMGKIVHKEFKANHAHIIDYANNSDKSDFLDIWLLANCHFAISTGTGLDAVADIFRKPVTYANYDSMLDIVMWSHSISAPKKLFWEDKNRYLNLTESIEHSHTHSDLFSLNSIKVVDLDEDEIRDVVMEMEMRLSDSWENNPRDNELQELFMKTYRKSDKYLQSHGWKHPKAYLGASYLREKPKSFFN
jgi:putative glycosyltransferase (TIGR04372 family)